jgi:TonB-linked SusC/RagA family outer membrane protein
MHIQKNYGKSIRLALMTVAAMFFSIGAIWAQNVKVSGKVSDQKGEPVAGVYVLVQGTKTGTTTDANGAYSLTAPSKATLVFSSMGFNTVTVPISGRSVLNVTLAENAELLNDVVVTAMGIKREKKALGYSVQEVKGATLLENRTTSVATSLNGKVAGMNISSTSVPGGSNRIVIRGNNSISGNNMPLIVVDGVPFDNTQGVGNTTDVSWGSGYSDTGDGISMLNADDIESISVLKGPSASALYGSRGGNGVIVVTTKKGVAGQTHVSFNSNFTVENVMTEPEFQNEYGQGTAGKFVLTSRNSWGPKMDGHLETDWSGTARPFVAKNNNFKDFMNTGTAWTNSVDFSTANEKSSIRVGLTNLQQKGVIPENKLSRTAFTTRATWEVLPKLHLDTKINYTYQKGEGRPEFSASGFNPIFALIYTPRSINLHEMKGIFNTDGSIIDWYPSKLTVVNNPYAITHLTGSEDRTNRIDGFMSLKYDVFSWLNAQVKYGIDTYSKDWDRWIRHGLVSSSTLKNGRYTNQTKNYSEANAEFLITAHKDNLFNSKLSGNLMFGGNMMHRHYTSTYQQAIGLNIPELYTIENGITINSSNYKYNKETQSLYGMAQLSWDNWLYLDVTARNDWSSTLPSSNRSYFYPSVSLGWVVTDMLYKYNVTLPKWFSYLKLRASYAEAGNDTDPYQLDPSLTTVANMTGGLMGVALPSTLANSKLKSEKIKSMEFGLEGKLFDGRLGFDVTYYKKKALNQIIAMPVSITTGYSNKYINAGQVNNYGWEVMLNGTPLETKNWRLDLALNFAKNNSKVVELTQGVNQVILAQPMGQNCYVVAKVGESYGQIYTNGFKVDANGNRLVGDNGKYITDATLRCSGNFNPDWTMGFSGNLSYKNWSFGFLIDIRKGGDIYLQSMMRLQANGQTKETLLGRDAYYTSGTGIVAKGLNVNTGNVNTVAIDPTSYWGQFYGNIGNYIYDASNVRMREMRIGYTFPRKWFAKTIIKSVKLSAVGNNLFFIYNNLPGFDPECTYSTGNGQGVETASLPSTRTFGFNLNVEF